MSETAKLLSFYRERVHGYSDVPAGYISAWSALCRAMLTHGGRLVVPPMTPEQDIDHLLSAGALLDLRAKLVRGRRNSCHENSAALWAAGKATAIGTGYALSDDGLWRQHSWGLVATERGARKPAGRLTVLETTVARDAYFGVELSGHDALLFARANAPHEVAAAVRAGTPHVLTAAGPPPAPIG